MATNGNWKISKEREKYQKSTHTHSTAQVSYLENLKKRSTKLLENWT